MKKFFYLLFFCVLSAFLFAQQTCDKKKVIGKWELVASVPNTEQQISVKDLCAYIRKDIPSSVYYFNENGTWKIYHPQYSKDSAKVFKYSINESTCELNLRPKYSIKRYQPKILYITDDTLVYTFGNRHGNYTRLLIKKKQ